MAASLDLRNIKYRDDDFKIYFTYKDLIQLAEFPEGPLIEIHDGELYMVPSPTPRHQEISINLTVLLNPHIKKNRLGKLLVAPIDVIFSPKSVVIPDLVFISSHNSSIIQSKYIKGVPDFIIEILSTNEKYDKIRKLLLYQLNRVKEYWIVDPFESSIMKYIHNGKELELIEKVKTGNIRIEVLELDLELNQIFE